MSNRDSNRSPPAYYSQQESVVSIQTNKIRNDTHADEQNDRDDTGDRTSGYSVQNDPVQYSISPENRHKAKC